jgi:hypothetical protein
MVWPAMMYSYDEENNGKPAHLGEMNRLVRSAELRPLVGSCRAISIMPRPWIPYCRDRESALATARAEVIATEDYYRRYHGQPLYISRWEGHSNEVANYIWASMLRVALTARLDLGSV